MFGIIFLLILCRIGQVDCRKNATIRSQRVETVQLPPQTMNLGPISCNITTDRLRIIEKSVEILLSRQISKNWDIQKYTHGHFSGLIIHITSFAQIHAMGNNHTKHKFKKQREHNLRTSVEIKNSHRKTKERLRNYEHSSTLLKTTGSVKNRTGIFKFDLSGIAHFYENPPSSQFLTMLFENIMRHEFIYLMEVIQEQEQEIIQNSEDACFSSLLLNIPSKAPNFSYRYIPETIQKNTSAEPEICKRRIYIAIFLYVVAAILACFLIFSKYVIQTFDKKLDNQSSHGGKKIKNSAHGTDSTNLKILSGFDDEKIVFLSTNKFYDQTGEDQSEIDSSKKSNLKLYNLSTLNKEDDKSNQIQESIKSNLIKIIDDGVIKGEQKEESHQRKDDLPTSNETESFNEFDHPKSPTGDTTKEKKYDESTRKKQDDKNKKKKNQDKPIGRLSKKRIDSMKPSKLEMRFDKVNEEMRYNAFIPKIPFTEEQIDTTERFGNGRPSNEQTIGLALQDSMRDRLPPWSLLLIDSQEGDTNHASEVMGGKFNAHYTENETRSEQPSTKAGLSTSSTEVPVWHNEMIKLPFDWDPHTRKKISDPKLSSTAGDTLYETNSTMSGDSYHSKRFKIKSSSISICSHEPNKIDSTDSVYINQKLRKTNSRYDSDDDWKSVTAAERKRIRDAQDELFYTDDTQIDDSNQSSNSLT